jgi:hypothetical protein
MYTFRDFILQMGRHGRYHMVIGFTACCAILAYHVNAVSSNPTQTRCTRYNNIFNLRETDVAICMMVIMERIYILAFPFESHSGEMHSIQHYIIKCV